MPRAFTGTFIDHLADGKDAESFLDALWKTNACTNEEVALSIISPALDHQKNKPCGDP